jgi:hypothetical protein
MRTLGYRSLKEANMHVGRLVLIGFSSIASHLAQAQRAPGDSLAAIAMADSALAAISRSDPIALTDLMVEPAMTYSIRVRDGRAVLGSRTKAENRARTSTDTVTERGFTPVAMLSGRLAVVWFPYDLYINGAWSHCGVDAFTMVRLDSGWKIASMAWSVEQPPVCQQHPSGPLRR